MKDLKIGDLCIDSAPDGEGILGICDTSSGDRVLVEVISKDDALRIVKHLCDAFFLTDDTTYPDQSCMEDDIILMKVQLDKLIKQMESDTRGVLV